MSFAHGKLAGFSIEDSSTTVRNISAYLTNIDFPQTADTAETTVFGSSTNSKTFVPGMKGRTISVEGVWDPTVDSYLNGVLGLEKAFVYYPNTTAATNTNFIKYAGNCIETSYDPTSPVDGAVTFSAEFQVTGTVTRTTA